MSNVQVHTRFIVDGPADVAVLIVTYNSGDDIDGLLESLRAEAIDTRVRVVVADNASSDDTLARVRAHDDVVAVETGGNLGYAGGINIAAKHAGGAPALLILNPDLRVHTGAVTAMLAALHHDSVGIVAPRIVDPTGTTAVSLFHEPGLTRAISDALLGRFWPGRPAVISEWDRREGAYAHPHAVDWASGAALMVSARAAAAVGEWDERFFLYSEETDYCRRTRDAGFGVMFEPAAVVEHAQGGSGSSFELDALLNVSRIRYMRKHSPRRAAAYRAVAILAATVRSLRSPAHGESARVLRNEQLWPTLPHASWSGTTGRPVASFVIPAHNEESVISGTLDALGDLIAAGSVEVSVVCNGCSDHTADAARRAGVRVLEIDEASKIAAINAGDAVSDVFPRIYLDADIAFPSAALPALLRALESPGVLSGRPRFEYDVRGATSVVRAYYRARLRMPAMSAALWGAGVYAVTADGHARISPFPRVTADDVYVDSAFTVPERALPLTPPVRVVVPRTSAALLAVLTRARRGPTEQGIDDGSRTLRALAATIRGPVSLWDASVYSALTVIARRRVASPAAMARWERDDTSRALARS